MPNKRQEAFQASCSSNILSAFEEEEEVEEVDESIEFAPAYAASQMVPEFTQPVVACTQYNGDEIDYDAFSECRIANKSDSRKLAKGLQSSFQVSGGI